MYSAGWQNGMALTRSALNKWDLFVPLRDIFVPPPSQGANPPPQAILRSRAGTLLARRYSAIELDFFIFPLKTSSPFSLCAMARKLPMG